MVRTRFAPSPTGQDAHIGTVYTALLNFAFARRNGGRFVYRLEDTDRERYVPGFEEQFSKSMSWFGLNWDEGPDVGGDFGPYRQSERLEIYKNYALELTEKSAAYFCFCSKERLDSVRQEQSQKGLPPKYDGFCRNLDQKEALRKFKSGESSVIRLKVPLTGYTVVNDVVRGRVEFENALIDDQVLFKSDGFPTYHLAVVVDDHLMQISHIIRAEEWLSSAPKHVLLYSAFGWSLPIFAHTPVLRNPDKSKLSKRKNPVWASWFKEQGFLPQAMLNFLALQAWSHPEGRDIFSLDEFINKFSLERLSKTGPAFDIKKLEWINGEYIRATDPVQLAAEVSKYLTEYSPDPLLRSLNPKKLIKSIPLIRDRIKKLAEFESLAGFLFTSPGLSKDHEFKHLNKITGVLKQLQKPWERDAWEKSLRELAEGLGFKAGEIFMDLRVAVSGDKVGPDLFESIRFLGEEETLARVEKVLMLQ